MLLLYKKGAVFIQKDKKERTMRIKVALLFALVGVCTFLLTGCIGGYTGHYSFSLEKVERPKETRQRYGEKENIFIEENRYVYEDNLLKILFFPTARQISFSIKNKTDHSIKIIWDEAAYIDEDNSSHRVMHSGVKFMSRDQPQAPSVVVAGGTLEDMVYPTDYAYYSGGWKQNPLLPTEKAFAEEVAEFTRRVKDLWGKRIGILLPLQIEGVINEYTFMFKITNAWVRDY